MKIIGILGIAIIIIAIFLVFLFTQQSKSKSIPKPITPPFSAPTWSSRGDWSIPFAVRYAISFVTDKEEGPLSDWSPYYCSSQFSNPILSRFPVSSYPGIRHIKLYRQFEGHEPIVIDVLPYPYLVRYTDKSGDDA